MKYESKAIIVVVMILVGFIFFISTNQVTPMAEDAASNNILYPILIGFGAGLFTMMMIKLYKKTLEYVNR